MAGRMYLSRLVLLVWIHCAVESCFRKAVADRLLVIKYALHNTADGELRKCEKIKSSVRLRDARMA